MNINPSTFSENWRARLKKFFLLLGQLKRLEKSLTFFQPLIFHFLIHYLDPSLVDLQLPDLARQAGLPHMILKGRHPGRFQ